MSRPDSWSRKTAVLEFSYPQRSGESDRKESRALDTERGYHLSLKIGDNAYGSVFFYSPMGDEQWRACIEAMRDCASDSNGGERYRFDKVFNAGIRLHKELENTHKNLREFLSEAGPRRLVIASDEPEIHRLPWEAMIQSGALRRHISECDISLVHTKLQPGFDPNSVTSERYLRLALIEGPGVPSAKHMREYVNSLVSNDSDSIMARGLIGLDDCGARDENSLRDFLKDKTPDICIIVAHGNLDSGHVDISDQWKPDTGTLAQLFEKRLMVLLWSCYSSMVHSWGVSNSLDLYDNGNQLVVGFFAELRQATAQELLREFFDTVFEPINGGDAESALTKMRARLYAEKRYGCVWASMNVWLRSPIDLRPAVRNGPRLPKNRWKNVPSNVTPDDEEIEKAIRKGVGGMFVLLSKEHRKLHVTEQMVSGYSGAVVLLEEPARWESRDEFLQILSELGQKETNLCHPADLVLALLDALDIYPSSLLLWSNASKREVDLFQLLESIPASVAVFLHQRSSDLEQPEGLDQFEAMVERGEFENASHLVNNLRTRFGDPAKTSPMEFVRFQRLAYRCQVKLLQHDEAGKEIKILQEFPGYNTCYTAVFEAFLLKGDLCHRKEDFDAACKWYSEALKTAGQEQDHQGDAGRAKHEMGYLYANRGERVLAERAYREALNLIEQSMLGSLDKNGTNPDVVLSSALGRLLRDYANFLVQDPNRAEEAAVLLRRSMAIHVLDGRDEQLAAVLRTRGRLEASQNRWEQAEKSLEASAAICKETFSRAALVKTMKQMADLALLQKHDAQGRFILEKLDEFLDTVSIKWDQDKGSVAMKLARVYWRKGDHSKALQYCEKAGKCELAERERSELQHLSDAITALKNLNDGKRQ